MADDQVEVTWAQARAIAWDALYGERGVQPGGGAGRMIDPQGSEDDEAYLAHEETIEFLATGDLLHGLVGGGAVLVERRGGRATLLGNIAGAERALAMRAIRG